MTDTIRIQEMQELVWKGSTRWFSHVDTSGVKQTHVLTYDTEEDLSRRLKNIMENLTVEELLTFQEEPLHRINAVYTKEMADDLEAMYGVDAAKEIEDLVSSEIDEFIKRNQ